jgi:thymidylate kinase
MENKPIILFEGLDGSGKTYALNHLKEFYEKQGETVHVVDSIPYPVFLESHDKEWFDLSNANTRYFEYMAWQVNNFYKNIKPYIGQSIILIDRFLPSCFAYNAIDVDKYSFLFLSVMDTMLRNFFTPTVTFLFDVSNDVLQVRHQKTEQPEKMTNLDFINIVRSEYDRFKTVYGDKWHVYGVRGDAPIEQILNFIINTVEAKVSLV